MIKCRFNRRAKHALKPETNNKIISDYNGCWTQKNDEAKKKQKRTILPLKNNGKHHKTFISDTDKEVVLSEITKTFACKSESVMDFYTYLFMFLPQIYREEEEHSDLSANLDRQPKLPP